MKFLNIDGTEPSKRKVIGIPGYVSKADSFGAGVNHLEFISKFGDARIIMPWEDFVEVDMLYLPGGLDTAPANYGEAPSYSTSNQDVHKEHFFRERLQNYIDAGIPILGVCLGAQMLAVKFGCKLTQDLLFHAQSGDRWKTAHKIAPISGKEYVNWSWIFKAFEVNSHHHQALTLNNISDQIEPIFVAENEDAFVTDDDKIVEVFKIRDRQIYGIQYHPEELYDALSREIIYSLLKLKKIKK